MSLQASDIFVQAFITELPNEVEGMEPDMPYTGPDFFDTLSDVEVLRSLFLNWVAIALQLSLDNVGCFMSLYFFVEQREPVKLRLALLKHQV